MAKLKYNISIIGGGNGGLAMAGHFGKLGHRICLYNRTFSKIKSVKDEGGVHLTSALKGFGEVMIV